MTFYEIIDSLIDVNAVPEKKRSGEGYGDARKEIHDNLVTIEDVTAACYHEAAHLIYATNLGFALKADVSGFQILGPHIKYYPATDDKAEWYEPTTMAISTPGLHKKLRDTHSAVFEMAKIGVAGGESVEFFRKKLSKPMWKSGNKDDWARFKLFASGVLSRVGNPPIDFPHNYWRDAETAVRHDFAQGLYDSEIEREALIAKIQVFPLVLLSENTKDSQ
jgi:hypothetical protein